VLQYRPFRNTDPPQLVEIWNEAFTGRGAVRLRTSSPLERFVFSKPYFDPAGLILAEEDGRGVGFIHAGFGANEQRAGLSYETGVVCLIGVRPTHQRRGIGTELLRRCEAYLRGRGARVLAAGPVPSRDPFYLGLYGGSDLPGFLATDPAAEPFFLRHGYHQTRTTLVFHRRLNVPVKVLDPRFVGYRQQYELAEPGRLRLASWWQECTFGLIEPHAFCLRDRKSGEEPASTLLWDMEGFSYRWNQPTVGVAAFEVKPAFRRQALGKFLLSQILRRVQEQFFELVEIQVAQDNAAALTFCRSAGFEQVDLGRSYEKRGD
jgi:ribosomal protein S18 acetylase RimI-like enzyme